MASPDVVERLSRYLEGELPDVERAEVERLLAADPLLRRELERLRRLDELVGRVARTLAVPLAAGHVDPALERALRADAPRRTASRNVRGRAAGPPLARRAAFVAAAAAILCLLGAGLLWWEMGEAGFSRGERIAESSPASSSGSLRQAERGSAGRTSAEAGALPARLVTEGSRVEETAEGLLLEAGTVLVRGEALLVRHDRFSMRVNGVAIASTEPLEALARVKHALATTPASGGMDMNSKLDSLVTAGARNVLAGALVALFVVEGHAEVTVDGQRATHLAERSVWTLPAGGAVAVAEEPALATKTAAAQRPGADATSQPSNAAATKSRDRAALARGELDTQAFIRTLQSPSTRVLVERCTASCVGAPESCVGTFHLLAELVSERGKGRVVEATIDPAYSVANPLVASCVVQVLAKRSFPAPSAGSALVRIPVTVERTPDRGLAVRLPEQMGRVSNDSNHASSGSRKQVSPGNSPSKGPLDAPVMIIVFSDFECPYCVKGHHLLQELEREYPGKLRIVFKQRPLPSHPHAKRAAEASLAAHAQGKFWPFHDLLFAHTQALDADSLERHAAGVGLDLARFRSALEAGTHRAEVEADGRLADELGARGTPSFLVNGRLIVGIRSKEQMKALIDAELAAAGR